MHSENTYGKTKQKENMISRKKKIMPHNLPAQWLASHVHEYDEKSVGVKSTHPKLCNRFPPPMIDGFPMK
jgi:hypothetical protein